MTADRLAIALAVLAGIGALYLACAIILAICAPWLWGKPRHHSRNHLAQQDGSRGRLGADHGARSDGSEARDHV